MLLHMQQAPKYRYPRRRSTVTVFVHGDRPPPWRPEAVVARPSSAGVLLTQPRCPILPHTRGSAGQHRLRPSLSESTISKSLAGDTHTSLNLLKKPPDHGVGQTYPVSPDQASWEATVVRNSKLMAHQRIRRLELELHRLRRLTAGLTPPAVSRVLAQRIARMESEAEQAESQRKSLEARLNELQLATPALQPTIVQLGLAVEPLPPTRGPSESSGVERLGMLRSIKDAETASSRPSATTLAVPRRADDTATSSDSLGTGMVATRLRRMSAAPPTVIVPLRLPQSYISTSLGTVFFEPSRQRISRSTTAAEPAEKDSAVAAELAVGKAAAEKAAAEAAVAEAVTAEACAAEEAVEAVEAAAEEAAAEEAAAKARAAEVAVEAVTIQQWAAKH